MTPDHALIVCRFVVAACALFLWGAQAFLWVGVSNALGAKLHQRLGSMFSVAIVLLAMAAACKIPLQAAILGNGWADALDLSLIHDLIVETRSGLALAVQMALAGALAIAYSLLSRHRAETIAGLAGLFLASLSISGHAAMNDGMIGLAHQINDSLHVLAVGAWIGALIPVVLLLTIRPTDQDWDASIIGLMRFSTLGHGAVAMVLITGLINSRLIIGAFWLDATIVYQRLLLLKITIAAAMVVLACINRYVFVPHMTHAPERALRFLRLSTLLEIGLGLSAIALVAAFGVMEPG
ncbi:putative copper resistance protein D [Agrobacterium vitis]|nr:putative copper resistance protein D [Agrobacterium vitis]MBE1439038.1 putative copper resistance protein D [Agrobacterium vitis]